MFLNHTIITFPSIPLLTRDAHKLRGYFGNLFKEKSPLLHNHFEDGSARYAYPLVQYKVINKVPMLVGLNEGAELMTELFLKIREIVVDGTDYPVLSKNITQRSFDLSNFKDLHDYRFETLWMALNQKNFESFMRSNAEVRDEILKNILTGNMISFYKGINFTVEEKILNRIQVSEHQTNFKNISMLAFKGNFTTNAPLPDYIGLGKAVSRGFGTIINFTTL